MDHFDFDHYDLHTAQLHGFNTNCCGLKSCIIVCSLEIKISMDISVHRLRFSDWQPSTIKTLASDPFSCKLAVGREDGDIEIRDSSHQWYVQATAPGQKGFNLQSLTWSAHASESGRLFGISLRGFIFEVSFPSIIEDELKWRICSAL